MVEQRLEVEDEGVSVEEVVGMGEDILEAAIVGPSNRSVVVMVVAVIASWFLSACCEVQGASIHRFGLPV